MAASPTQRTAPLWAGGNAQYQGCVGEGQWRPVHRWTIDGVLHASPSADGQPLAHRRAHRHRHPQTPPRERATLSSSAAPAAKAPTQDLGVQHGRPRAPEGNDRRAAAGGAGGARPAPRGHPAPDSPRTPAPSGHPAPDPPTTLAPRSRRSPRSGVTPRRTPPRIPEPAPGSPRSELAWPRTPGSLRAAPRAPAQGSPAPRTPAPAPLGAARSRPAGLGGGSPATGGQGGPDAAPAAAPGGRRTRPGNAGTEGAVRGRQVALVPRTRLQRPSLWKDPGPPPTPPLQPQVSGPPGRFASGPFRSMASSDTSPSPSPLPHIICCRVPQGARIL
nr:uncharacterized protein LOC111770657 [Equus caballus]